MEQQVMVTCNGCLAGSARAQLDGGFICTIDCPVAVCYAYTKANLESDPTFDWLIANTEFYRQLTGNLYEASFFLNDAENLDEEELLHRSQQVRTKVFSLLREKNLLDKRMSRRRLFGEGARALTAAAIFEWIREYLKENHEFDVASLEELSERIRHAIDNGEIE